MDAGGCMNKIVVIPLDERPCNYDFNQLLVEDTDVQVVVPPRSIMGDKKLVGSVEEIWDFLESHIAEADGAIISIDTLLYSGIIPSRLHHYSIETLVNQLNRLKTIKEKYPHLKLFAYNLIMRNPSYSSSEEEPDYYEDWGREIHRYGVINHKKELGIATEEELSELSDIHARLPKEYLDDYLKRREVNLAVNKHFLTLVQEGYIDFAIIPQDDSSPYGLTAKDQQIILEEINRLDINTKVYMYPGADEVTNTLLARMINEKHGKRPLVYVKYTSFSGGSIIPLYEDRPVHETIKYQILAAGGLVTSSVHEADLVLIVNVPPSGMIEAPNQNVRLIEYDSFRNLIEAVEFAEYVIDELNKPVIIGDIAYANGGDLQLIRLLRQKGLFYKLAGYAGWNTSSNTLGTCIPQGMIFYHYGNRKGHLDFLALRYVEDAGYCAHVRGYVTQHVLPELRLDYFNVDGKRGKVADLVKQQLQQFADEIIVDDTYRIVVKDSYMPWRRMFEVGLAVEVVKKGD